MGSQQSCWRNFASLSDQKSIKKYLLSVFYYGSLWDWAELYKIIFPIAMLGITCIGCRLPLQENKMLQWDWQSAQFKPWTSSEEEFTSDDLQNESGDQKKIPINLEKYSG